MTDEPAATRFGSINRIPGWLQYSQFHIGLIALALATASYALIGTSTNDFVVALCVCGATAVYIFDRLVMDSADLPNHPGRTAWFEANRIRMSWLSRLLAISCVPLMWLLSPRQILLAVLLAIIGLAYVTPPRPLRSLRKVKPFLIAAAWTTAVVGLPGLEHGTGSIEVLFLWLYRFIYLVPNTLISDVLDAAGDRQAGYETVATNLTRHQLRIVLGICIALAATISVASVSLSAVAGGILVDCCGMLFYLRFIGSEVGERRKFLLDCALLWPLVLFFV